MDRFWNKVSKTDTCWIWTACTNNEGYGVFSLDAKSQKAHRLAYTWLVGEIPQGAVLDHTCRVRNCVNPEHLEAVSDKTNILRGNGMWRKRLEQTHCVRGHLLSGSNIRYEKNKRRCKTCVRIRYELSKVSN